MVERRLEGASKLCLGGACRWGCCEGGRRGHSAGGRYLALDVHGQAMSPGQLRGSDEALVGMLGILTSIKGEQVIMKLGEGVDLSAPAVSVVSPAKDRFMFIGIGESDRRTG